ncbi:MAG TPA: hypothetical protein VK435_02660, partial [Thermodesulfovibrionales bacterium]|nr:hypothetical protein [Thermodesulfovibrionales bacterium]
MQESDIKRLDARDSISETTIHGFRSVLLGAPFLVIGSFSTVLMFKDGVSGYMGDMPFWLLILLTCSFPLAGLLFIGHGLSGLLRQKRTRNLQQRYPNEAWKWDYPWDPAGIKDTSLRRMRKVFRVAIA